MPRRKNKPQSHDEIMQTRFEKKRKKSISKKANPKKADVKSKEYHLKEFLKLSSLGDVTNKDVAMKVMEIIEEVKDEGMNDKRYMDIMNHLMKIHKSDEEPVLTNLWDNFNYTRYPRPRSERVESVSEPNSDPTGNWIRQSVNRWVIESEEEQTRNNINVPSYRSSLDVRRQIINYLSDEGDNVD